MSSTGYDRKWWTHGGFMKRVAADYGNEEYVKELTWSWRGKKNKRHWRRGRQDTRRRTVTSFVQRDTDERRNSAARWGWNLVDCIAIGETTSDLGWRWQDAKVSGKIRQTPEYLWIAALCQNTEPVFCETSKRTNNLAWPGNMYSLRRSREGMGKDLEKAE